MSNDLNGLPGILIAVKHLVSVLVGAPGPVQAASAAPGIASNTAANSAVAKTETSTVAFENPSSLGVLKIRFIAGLLVANRHSESHTSPSPLRAAPTARDSAEAADSQMTGASTPRTTRFSSFVLRRAPIRRAGREECRARRPAASWRWPGALGRTPTPFRTLAAVVDRRCRGGGGPTSGTE